MKAKSDEADKKNTLEQHLKKQQAVVLPQNVLEDCD